MTVDVYGKPGCVQCKYTIERLENEGHNIHYHDITKDKKAKQVVEESGKMQLPLVVAGEKTWHGLSPDKIKSLAA